jgi:hypothetical protein
MVGEDGRIQPSQLGVPFVDRRSAMARQRLIHHPAAASQASTSLTGSIGQPRGTAISRRSAVVPWAIRHETREKFTHVS